MTESIETRWEKFSDAGRECSATKDYDKAEEAYLAAMRAAEHFGDDDPRLPATLNALARVYCMRNKFFPAAALLHRLVAIAERTLGDQHPRVAGVVTNLAEMYARLGDIRQELALRERAHSIRKNSGETDEATLAKGYERLVFLRRKHAEATGQPMPSTPTASVTPVSVPAPSQAKPSSVAAPVPVSTTSFRAESPISTESVEEKPFEPHFINLSMPIAAQIRQPVSQVRPQPAPEPLVVLPPRAVSPDTAQPVRQRLAPEPFVNRQAPVSTPPAPDPVRQRLAPAPFINPPPDVERFTSVEPVRGAVASPPSVASEFYEPTADAVLTGMSWPQPGRFKSRRFAMIGGGLAIAAVGLWIAMSGGPDGAEASAPTTPVVSLAAAQIQSQQVEESKRRSDEEAVELGMAAVGALNQQSSAQAAALTANRSGSPVQARTEEQRIARETEDTSTKLSMPKPVNIDKIVGGIDASTRANVDSANMTLGYTAPTFKKP